MLQSLRAQGMLPAQIVIVDASDNDRTKQVVAAFAEAVGSAGCEAQCVRAEITGAAAQRNQGVALAKHAVVGFFDDDILFEADCIARLWQALQADPQLGGVNAMITNQSYQPPGIVSRTLFRILAGEPSASYAGQVLGPAVNLLPQDRGDLPEVVAVDWLNTTGTLYRREALPAPPFSTAFTGYSLMEDLALSLTVGRNWKLANVRTARIYHDSQTGTHKDKAASLSRMELVNRHYVMVDVLQRRCLRDHAKLLLWECFQLGVCAIQKRGGREFWQMLQGKIQGLGDILCGRPLGSAQ